MMRALLVLPVLFLVAFTATITVEPEFATSQNDLTCLVEVIGGGALQANITWYQNGAPYTDSDETLALTSGQQEESTIAIPAAQVTRGHEWRCEATVFNETQTQAFNSTLITIENSAPTVTFPVGVFIVYETDPFGPLQALAFDPDGDTVQFASAVINVTNDAESPLFTITSTGIIQFTPTFEQVGNHTIAILATDGDLVGGRNVRFDVRAINEDPYFVPPLEDQQATQDEVFSYIIGGFDREDDPFNFTMQTDLAELELASINATHAEIRFTTGVVQHRHGGLHEINVTIFEIANTTKNTTETFLLNVTVFNEIPEFDPIISPQAAQGEEFNMTVTATDADPDDVLLFSIETTCPLPNPWTINTLANDSTLAIGNIYVGTLTNDHVACRDVTFVVTDFDTQGFAKNQTRVNITLNITNINDPPELHELSFFANLPVQQNISNLTAPTGLQFRYRVNATDPDLLTYEGDELFFSDNSTLFTIEEDTGWIVFTPQVEDIGSHTIHITVQDLAGEQDSIVMQLEIIENNPPTLIDPGVVQCEQHENCTIILEGVDPDPGDILTFTLALTDYFVWSGEENLTAAFTLEQQTLTTTQAWQNFTNEMVGWFTYNVTVRDRFGAEDQGILVVNVSNINDPPFFDPEILFPEPVVETYPVTFFVTAQDPDFINIESPDVDENLTLTATITGPNTGLFSPIKQSDTQWLISFEPQASDVGEYTIAFLLQDLQGASVTQEVNITIFEQSQPPNITAVRPFFDGQTEIFDIKQPRNLLGDNTTVRLQEGATYTFNITYIDPDTAPENVTVRWYVDEELVQERRGDEAFSLVETFGFFDEGEYVYTVRVEDNRFEVDEFTWFVEVLNTNRPPVVCYALSNRNVTATTQLNNYMYVFYDPDDHPNHVQPQDQCSPLRTHASQLTYTAQISNPSLLEITFSQENVVLTPRGDGTVEVTYRATDPFGAFNQTNTVTYEVSAPQQTTTPTPAPSTGGGGASPTPIPIPTTQDPEPMSIRIITPSSLVMYRNQTMEVPITVENPTTRVFQGVDLQASANADDVSVRFTQSSFPALQPGETRNITLFVENYRSQGTYEIRIDADVQNPSINDSAIIFVNALEQESFGDAVNTRVSFAQDLLSSHPECLELNEFIGRARDLISQGRIQQADIVLREVIDACRFLVSQPGVREEVPQGLSLAWLQRFRYANAVLIALLFVLIGIAILLVMHYYSAAKQD